MQPSYADIEELVHGGRESAAAADRMRRQQTDVEMPDSPGSAHSFSVSIPIRQSPNHSPSFQNTKSSRNHDDFRSRASASRDGSAHSGARLRDSRRSYDGHTDSRSRHHSDANYDREARKHYDDYRKDRDRERHRPDTVRNRSRSPYAARNSRDYDHRDRRDDRRVDRDHDRRSQRDRSHSRDRARYNDRYSNNNKKYSKHDDRYDDAYSNHKVASSSPRPSVVDDYKNSASSHSPRNNENSASYSPKNYGSGSYKSSYAPKYHGKSPRPVDDGTDQRTVFISQLARGASERHLKKFFEDEMGLAFSKANILRDRGHSRASKGMAYVEFRDDESVQKALQCTGRQVCGIPIIVSLSEAEKNRVASKTEGQPTQTNGIPFHRLYVGNIHFSVCEKDLSDMFQVYGDIDLVELVKDDTGRSRGYAFVQFVEPADAKAALTALNGFELVGRPMRVGLGRDDKSETTERSLQRFDHNQPNGGQQRTGTDFVGSEFSGAGGRGHSRNDSDRAATDRAKSGPAGAAGVSALDDSEVGGVNYSNYSRHALMQRLAREEDALPIKTSPATNGGSTTTGNRNAAPTSSNKTTVHANSATRCVLVKDAYNEAEETDRDWVTDLEKDFAAECSEKYGRVVFCRLNRDSPDGEVYIKFKDVRGGDNAIKGLNGRMFGGRMLRAEPVVDAIFNTMFPASTNL